MKKYKDWAPTSYDVKGLRPDQRDWLVAPLILTRDPDCLERANWQAFLKLIPESDTVEVCEFHHWDCGYFDIILIDPADTNTVNRAEEIKSGLDNYPVIDDNMFSAVEFDSARQAWKSFSVRNRYDYFRRCSCTGSIFQIRRDDLPANDCGDFVSILAKYIDLLR